jgi:tetratricopeptide (TPR) repeat protein
LLSAALGAASQTDDALSRLGPILENRSKNGLAWADILAGLLYTARFRSEHKDEDDEAARAAFTNALDRLPKTAGNFAEYVVHFGLGTVHLEAGRLEDAAEALGAAIETNGKLPAARLSLGLVRYEQGKRESQDSKRKAEFLEKSIAEFSAAAPLLGSNAAAAYRGRAEAHIELGEHDSAIENYRLSIQKESAVEKRVGDLVRLATLCAQKEPQRASELLDELGQIGDVADAHLVRAILHLRWKDLDKALEQLDRYFEKKDSPRPNERALRAVLLWNARRWMHAMTDLDLAIKGAERPEDAVLFRLLRAQMLLSSDPWGAKKDLAVIDALFGENPRLKAELPPETLRPYYLARSWIGAVEVASVSQDRQPGDWKRADPLRRRVIEDIQRGLSLPGTDVGSVNRAALTYVNLIGGFPGQWYANDPDLRLRRAEYATAGAKLLWRGIEMKASAPLEIQIELWREISKEDYDPLRRCLFYDAYVAPWCMRMKREADRVTGGRQQEGKTR